MQPVPETALQPHLHDYFHDWKQQRKPGSPEARIRVLSDRTYAFSYCHLGIPLNRAAVETVISVPREYLFDDFGAQLRTAVGMGPKDPCSLWLVANNDYPSRRIDPKLTVKSRLDGQRSLVFVSSFVNEPMPDEVPLLVGFYDPSILTSPLQYVRFTVLGPAQTLRGLENEIRAQFGLGGAVVDAYLLAEASVRKLDIELAIAAQEVRFGMIVFQLAEPSLVKQPAPEGLAIYRAIDFLPEFACPTVKLFIESLEETALYNICQINTPETVQFRLDIFETVPIPILLRCIRAILAVPADDSILLFDREPGKAAPSPQPIATNEKANIRQLVRSRFLYYHILPGVTQEQLADKVTFKLSVVDRDLIVLNQPLLILPKVHSAGLILGKLVAQGIVPADSPLRLLQLSGSRIVREITDSGTDLSALTGFTWRAEVVPDDQVGAPAGELVRVTLTHNRQVPKTACFGWPFLFRVVPGERFAETKERLIARASVEKEKASFGYTNDSQNAKDFKALKDDDELAALLHGQSTMVYIFLPGAHGQAIGSGGSVWNRGVRIYN
jgi:hypothetical protein